MNEEGTKLRLAIFDFDGTLIRNNSYHVFLKWLISRKSIKSPFILGAIIARKLGLISRLTLMKLALQQLKGLSKSELEAIGTELFQKSIFPQINSIGLQELKKRAGEGYRVIILSAAFDFMLKPFCAANDIEFWRSSEIAFQNGICEGRLSGSEFRAEEKLLYLQRQFTDETINWESSRAYSDELTDLPILTAVGNGFLVENKVSHHLNLPPTVKRLEW